MLFRSLPILALLVGLSPPGAAQFELLPSTSTTTWTHEDGLPQNTVRSLAFDEDGYLWVGTLGGLARFDGQRFDVLDVGNRPDLPANRIQQLLFDPDGTLWLGLQNIGVVRYRDDVFTRMGGSPNIRQMAVGAGGELWVLSYTDLGRVENGRIEMIREGDLFAIFPAGDGALWLLTVEGRLVHLDNGTERELGQSIEFGLNVVMEDRTGGLWLSNGPFVWRSPDPLNTPFERLDSAPGGVLDIVEGRDGAVWLCTRNSLWKYDTPESVPTRFASVGYRSVVADARGNLWCGNWSGGGLFCLRSSPLHQPKLAYQLDPGNTWSITAGRENTALVVQNRRIHELTDGTRRLLKFPLNTNAALVDQHGDLWVGQGLGLVRVSGEMRTEFPGLARARGKIRVLHEGRDGVLWVGSDLGLFKKASEAFEPIFPGELEGLYCLLEDQLSGVLWAGTARGLARMSGDSLEWITREQGLSAGVVRTLHQDAEGVLWVGTYGGGLSRVEDGNVKRFTRDNGLSDNFLACILEDNNGRLWINSNRGPFVVRRSDLNAVASGASERVACVLFTDSEGAREANGGTQPSGWMDAQDRMWFPSTSGVTVADPSELSMVEAAPVVRIEALVVDADRAFTSRFAALGFSAPKRVRTQYRLLGQSSTWQESSGPGEVRYSYLKPGAYKLQVRSRNGFGPWSPIVSRSFEVHAKYHETTTFLVSIVALLALCAFGLVELRIRASRERAHKLESLHRQREEAQQALSRSQASLSRLSRTLLVNQESERRRISSELHDDVTQRIAALAIQVELVHARLDSDTDRARDQLEAIVLEAQQLAGDVQQLSRRLHPVGLRTLGLSEAIRQESDAFTRRCGTEVRLEDHLALDEVQEDLAVGAFRVFQESLHNIEKHANAKRVDVEIELAGGVLQLTVSDHGRGFDAERAGGSGLGLITMQERAAALGGELTITSQPGEGTTVRFTASRLGNTP